MKRYMVMTYNEEDSTVFVLFDTLTRQTVYWATDNSSDTAYQDICKMRDDFNRGGR